jgi:16S rRNA (guanine1207-N2)-methyltransferase
MNAIPLAIELAVDLPQGCRWLPRLDTQLVKELYLPDSQVYETMRPEVLKLEALSIASSQKLSPGHFHSIIIIPTRQRIETLGLIAHGLKHLAHDGVLLFVCDNDLGARGYMTHLKELCGDFEAESKRKCRYVKLKRSMVINEDLLRLWQHEAGMSEVDGHHTVPGIYGWNKVDRGSKLLLTTLPSLIGVGADLGAGSGYLSREILQKNSEVKIHLLEAEYRALACAKANLVSYPSCEFHWVDITKPEGRMVKGLDWIVMNPPFHEGNTADTALGLSFIDTASSMLKVGGKLFLVANVFLGYESTISRLFKTAEKVLVQDGFKVIHAER